MERFARRVGLGLAARGDVADVVGWAVEARDAAWIRSGSTTPTSSATPSATAPRSPARLGEPGPGDGFRLALGAVNPYTRHPVVLAMTGSALDEMLPGRIVMGLGTGLPLRLKQMGIPYTPDAALEGVSRAIDQIRLLWAGERLPSATPGLPPIQPMFPPPHRIPLFIAAYRKEFVALAGQKADGYLARPAESIPSLKGILERLRRRPSRPAATRPSIETAGYLLSLVDDDPPRGAQPGQARAVRDLHDVGPGRRLAPAGRLRRRSCATGSPPPGGPRTTTTPASSSPTTCSTRSCCAARARTSPPAHGASTPRPGLDLPLLQPVVQEDGDRSRRSSTRPRCTAPGRRRGRRPSASAHDAGHRPRAGAARTGRGAPSARRGRSCGRSPITASVVPVAAGGALAAVDGRFSWPPFLAALAGGVLLHSGTNVVNEVYDVRKGIDTITSPRASHAVLKGRLSERGALRLAYGAFALAIAIGVVPGRAARAGDRRPRPARPRGGYFYTAPPFALQVPRPGRAARLRCWARSWSWAPTSRSPGRGA